MKREIWLRALTVLVLGEVEANQFAYISYFRTSNSKAGPKSAFHKISNLSAIVKPYFLAPIPILLIAIVVAASLHSMMVWTPVLSVGPQVPCFLMFRGWLPPTPAVTGSLLSSSFR